MLHLKHLALLTLLLPAACATHPTPCAPPAAVTLLGEQHDSAADHAWERATIARLYAAAPTLILGAEMFPRSAQPVLDQWSAGRLPEPAFLAHWHDYWGFDAALYLPIWRFARDHHIPILALNVSHHLVHEVAHAGWAAIPVARREGITTPAPATPAYRAILAEAMSGHGGPPMTPARLDHFIDAQLVWDRAMAQAIAEARARMPQRPIVAIMGAGHLEGGEGVPRQLTALGVTGVVTLPSAKACRKACCPDAEATS
jgi:uncharacterized iron-regulated protein